MPSTPLPPGVRGRSSWSSIQAHAGSRTLDHYLLTADERRRDGFPDAPITPPAPHRHEATSALIGDDAQGSDAARVFGLDCEMVLTETGHALARVALVALVAQHEGLTYVWPQPCPAPAPRWESVTLLDALIRPDAPITDALTHVHGLTPDMLADAAWTQEDARAALLATLRPHDALCGHGLHADLHALDLAHPRVLDTTALYPHHNGPPSRYTLKHLARLHLRRDLQTGHHSPAEDAAAALDLARLTIDRARGRLVWRLIPDGAPRIFLDMDAPRAVALLGLQPEDVCCVYLRGSRAVGYAGTRDDGSPSDWDLVIVLADTQTTQADVLVSYGNVEAALYDLRTFRDLVRDGCIWALECIFAAPDCRWREDIDLRAELERHRAALSPDLFNARLRRSVSFEAGRQWTKARQYLQNHANRYSARKRIFIAARFLVYGIEVARTGRIRDLSSANALWHDHLRDDPSTTWAQLHATYAPLYRALRDAFRAAAPKRPRYAGFRDRDPLRARRALRAARAQNTRAAQAPPTPPALDAMPTPPPDAPLRLRLATTRFLRACGDDADVSLALLTRTFDLGLRRHAQHPNVVQLRYTPTSTPRAHPIVRECRGLILDAADDWRVLAYPFDRFFDSGDPDAQHTPLDPATTRVYDKLDGSLAVLYRYDGTWRVASSRRPDASGLMGLRDPQNALPFDRLFWDIWDTLGYCLPPDDAPRRCYMFELTSPRHTVLVRHDHDALTLIGARDLDTGHELEPAPVARALGWACVQPRDTLRVNDRLYDLNDPAQRQLAVEAVDGAQHEGFILRDARFNRAKLKSPDYIRMAWMFPLCPTRHTVNTRRLIAVVQADAAREFALYCPEHRRELAEVTDRYDALIADAQTTYDAIAHLGRKPFALNAQQHRFASLLFGMRSFGASPRQLLQTLPVKRVERLLGLKPAHTPHPASPAYSAPDAPLSAPLQAWLTTTLDAIGPNPHHHQEPDP